MEPKPTFAKGGISCGPNAFYHGIELEQAFHMAVSNNWSEEIIDAILDQKNLRDAEFRKTLLMGFTIAVPRNDSIFVMANDYSV